jgi:hypothetical protein
MGGRHDQGGNLYHARNGRPHLLFLLFNTAHYLIIWGFAKGSYVMKMGRQTSLNHPPSRTNLLHNHVHSNRSIHHRHLY